VLGETLSPAQWAGGALIVGGTLLVSLRSQPHATRKRARFNTRLAALMLACALALAVSSLIFKIFALRDEFWPTTFWMFVGEALFGAALLGVASYRRQFIDLLRSNPVAVLSINAVNELINLGGGLGRELLYKGVAAVLVAMGAALVTR
jgi:drug/metabolite transporter (DMT)-like permease